MMETNLRGELTVERSSITQGMDLVEAVARSLKISSAKEYEELRKILFPAMLNAAVVNRDIPKIEALKECVSNPFAFYFHFYLILYRLDLVPSNR